MSIHIPGVPNHPGGGQLFRLVIQALLQRLTVELHLPSPMVHVPAYALQGHRADHAGLLALIRIAGKRNKARTPQPFKHGAHMVCSRHTEAHRLDVAVIDIIAFGLR